MSMSEDNARLIEGQNPEATSSSFSKPRNRNLLLNMDIEGGFKNEDDICLDILDQSKKISRSSRKTQRRKQQRKNKHKRRDQITERPLLQDCNSEQKQIIDETYMVFRELFLIKQFELSIHIDKK